MRSPSSNLQQTTSVSFLIFIFPCLSPSLYSPCSSYLSPTFLKQGPFLTPRSQVSSTVCLLLRRTTFPFFRPMSNSTSITSCSSLLKRITPRPCRLSSLKCPSKVPSSFFSMPLPSFFPSWNYPSQQSPLALVSLPFPSNSPFSIPPSQVAPEDSCTLQFRSQRRSSRNCPSQLSPLLQFIVPAPSFLPLMKCPLQVYPFSPSQCSSPSPSNSPSVKPPSYSNFFRPFSNLTSLPCPSYSPFLKSPTQLDPSGRFNSPLPSNLSFLKQPLQVSPLGVWQKALPTLHSFSIAPSQMVPSLNATRPLRKLPSRNSPSCVQSLVVSVPFPQYCRLRSCPSQLSPDFFVMDPVVHSPSSKLPLSVSPLTQVIWPLPCSLPAALTSPSYSDPSKYLIFDCFSPITPIIFMLRISNHTSIDYHSASPSNPFRNSYALSMPLYILWKPYLLRLRLVYCE